MRIGEKTAHQWDSEWQLLMAIRRYAYLSLQAINQQFLSHQEQEGLTYQKGFWGHFVEALLQVKPAVQKDYVDIPELGIEIKTLPVTEQGDPLESTFITAASIGERIHRFEESRLYKKLSRILWVPIVVSPIRERSYLGEAFLWSPSEETRAVFREDWHELSRLLVDPTSFDIGARAGVYLQLRPKARCGKELRRAWSLGTTPFPKAYYLRRRASRALLESYLSRAVIQPEKR